MHCISCALKRKVEKPLLFKQTLRSRFTCLACQHFSFQAKKSLNSERPFSLALRVVSLLSCLSRLAPSVRRAVICVSRAFCSTDQEKRETARSLGLPIHTRLEVMSSEMHVFAVNQPLCCTTRVEGRKYIHPRSHVVVLRYGSSNKHRAHLFYL